LRIDVNKPANVIYARDTRPSGPELVASSVDGLIAMLSITLMKDSNPALARIQRVPMTSMGSQPRPALSSIMALASDFDALGGPIP